MVVLDFGGLKYGYGSDTTRTVHVGEPEDIVTVTEDGGRRLNSTPHELRVVH